MLVSPEAFIAVRKATALWYTPPGSELEGLARIRASTTWMMDEHARTSETNTFAVDEALQESKLALKSSKVSPTQYCSAQYHYNKRALSTCSAPLNDCSCECLIILHYNKESRRRGLGAGGGLELDLAWEKGGKLQPCSQFLHMQMVFQSDVTSNADYSIQ